MRPEASRSSAGDCSSSRFQEEELRIQAVLELLPAGAYTCDAAGLITYFNRHAVELWGREPELDSPVDRFCGSFRLYSPDGTPVSHENCWVALALTTGQPQVGREIVIERPDGSRRNVLAHVSPLRHESGEILGAINIFVDIGDRLRADEMQSRLAAIVESSTDAIISKTLDGTVTSWNAAAERLFGYTAREMLGTSITRLIPPERLDEEQEILKRVSRGERVEHFETVRLAKDGRLIDVSVCISPIRDRFGRIVGASKVARDISAERQAAEALRAADRRKDEFLATLAHELRNPLAPICNALHLLALSDDPTPAVRHVREILERQVNHMVRLVDDLMDIARISQGRLELRKEHIELTTVIGSAVEISRPLIEGAGHQLAVMLPSEPLIVDADSVRLAQVLANLLNNGAKYTPTGGQIWLAAKREDGDALVSVRDTGRGIEPDMLASVCDMFAQADGQSKSSNGGLGIGLALASRLTELHGGRLEAFSEGPGKGSEFVVRLPLSIISPKANMPAQEAHTPSRRPLPSRRILVVDDSQSSAFLLGKLLEAMDQQVTTTDDADAALRLACEIRPHVIISDIAMPQMDGYELARRLRGDPLLNGSVLVALTGYDRECDRRQARQAGFDHFLVKPVQVDALQELLLSVPQPTHPIPANTPNT